MFHILLSVIQECSTRVSYKSVPHQSARQECPTRVSCKSVPQECRLCFTRVPYKSVREVWEKEKETKKEKEATFGVAFGVVSMVVYCTFLLFFGSQDQGVK